MNRIRNFIWLGSGIVLGILLSFPLAKAKALSSEAEEYLQILHEIVSYIETDYVEKVDEANLYKGAIQGILTSLNDPHSRFLSKDEFRDLQSETRGSFAGLGIEVVFMDGKIVIVNPPLDDTPASRAGLRAEDKIIEINGKSTAGMNLEKAIGEMRGKAGTGVQLRIEREKEIPFTVNLIREMIKIQYLKTEYLPKEQIGYVRLREFMGKDNTAGEFSAALENLQSQGAKAFIIDLRNNPGGLLDLSIQIAELFLDPGNQVVSVRGRGGQVVRTYTASKNAGKFRSVPVTILINQGSASASEILAGALKDYKRAKLVGSKSFGKGSVQNIYNLSHESGVALTIQKYFTPAGTSIHGIGIDPDVAVEAIAPLPEEKEEIDRLLKSGTLKAFIEKNPEYKPESVSKFLGLLRRENYKIQESLAKYIYFSEVNKGKTQALILREFDPQLEKAIEITQKR